MRHRVALIAMSILALALLASCSVDEKPAEKPEAALQEHIAGADSALERFADALASGDSSTVASLAGEHFVLIDDGRALDLETALASLRAHPGEAAGTRTRGKFATHLKGRVAWSHYHVTVDQPASGAGKAQAMPGKRVETAVLARDNSEHWQVMLFTSTPEPAGH